MAVTMAEISKLRALTSAGLMDCKKALAETDGDIEAAVEILRYMGKFDARILDLCCGSGCIGCAIAGLGGLYFIMDYTGGSWTNGGFGDRGWLAIALVIFSVWKPSVSIIASYLFGALYIAAFVFGNISFSGREVLKILPYVITIIVLIATSMMNKREHQPPASLGLNYFREDR